MRKQYVIPAIGLLVVGLSSAFWMVSAADPSETVRRSTDVTLAKDSDFLSGFVPARTTIAHLFENHMIQGADTPVLVSSIASAIDVRKLRAGQPYTIDRLLDGRVRRFEYEIDAGASRRGPSSRASPSAKGAPRFIATVERIPKQTTVVAVEGDINRETNSLSAAIDKAGERIELALGMADVFSGEIDFNSDLQPGDKFRVLVERHTREGKLSGYGAILAAEFVNDGRTPARDSIHARRRIAGVLRRERPLAETLLPEVAAEVRAANHVALLELAQASDPRLRARAQRRRLLRAGRRAGRISGARCRDAGRVGRAAAAAPSRCGIRTATRPNTCTCRRLRSAPAPRVGQGDLVGRVGKTGLATGVHLHYGLKKNGRYVNPVIEHRNMPPGEPVPAGFDERVQHRARSLLRRCSSIHTARAPTTTDTHDTHENN